MLLAGRSHWLLAPGTKAFTAKGAKEDKANQKNKYRTEK
jgi:hypothetical protein